MPGGAGVIIRVRMIIKGLQYSFRPSELVRSAKVGALPAGKDMWRMIFSCPETEHFFRPCLQGYVTAGPAAKPFAFVRVAFGGFGSIDDEYFDAIFWLCEGADGAAEEKAKE